MIIDLTVKEYQTLLELAYMGNLVFNSQMERHEMNMEYFDLIDKLVLTAAESKESKKLLKFKGDEITFPPKFYEKCENAMDSYIDGVIAEIADNISEEMFMPEIHWSLVEGESIQLAHLKVSIKGIKPPIFRELIIPMDMSFQEMHILIQAAFGWENAHLYQFNYKNEIICEENTLIDQDYISAELERLSDSIVLKGDTIFYEYDFGDSWVHSIKISKIYDSKPDEKYPRCLKGGRACPPEDVGGVFGYYHMLEVLSEPESEEYSDLLEWLGDGYDPEYFSLDEINKKIDKILWL